MHEIVFGQYVWADKLSCLCNSACPNGSGLVRQLSMYMILHPAAEMCMIAHQHAMQCIAGRKAHRVGNTLVHLYVSA